MGWTAIALSRDVPPGTTRGVLLDGEELVVWRGSDGVPHVWDDRCPHRGMRLSFGFVRDNALNCLYHGWTYAGGGQCVRIPAHPDLQVPATITATARAVHESSGLIWTAPARELEAPPAFAAARPVATMAIDRPLAEVEARCPPANGPLVSLPVGNGAMLLAMHAAGHGRTMVHSVTEDLDPAAAWTVLRRFRDELELEPARRA